MKRRSAFGHPGRGVLAALVALASFLLAAVPARAGVTLFDDEFCFEQFYASAAARDADFANGSYTVTASNVAETATDTEQVLGAALRRRARPARALW